jgi:hypothetical protein
MTPDSIAELRCGSCGVMNPALNVFCGACGGSLEPTDGSVLTRSSSLGGYLSPRRMLVLGTIAFLIGLPAAIASSLALQGGGITGFLLGLVGVREVSTVTIGVFIVGFLFAVIGACLFLYGAALILARSRARDRGEDAYKRAQPIASHLAHESRQQLADAIARGQPKVAQAASRGRDTAVEDLLPRVSAAADHGREQWRRAAPGIGSAATYARQRLVCAARRRLDRAGITAPVPATPQQTEFGVSRSPTDAASREAPKMLDDSQPDDVVNHPPAL